jgi:ubiquinone/menaquinone biosynthesis C-methylase UbiE
VNPNYEVESLEFKKAGYNLELKKEKGYKDSEDLFCARIPDNAVLLPPRINDFKQNEIMILDVGCSSGANLFLLKDLLQKYSDKDIKVKGYDNDRKRLKEAKKGKSEYSSLECLLHPIVREVVDKYFFEKGKDSDQGYETAHYFSLKKGSVQELENMLHFGDAKSLPEPDKSSDVTLCLYVLRYHNITDQLKIFKELIRVTKPGGFIFTEEFSLKKEENGVSPVSPWENPAISFYDLKKALFSHAYNDTGEFTKEAIWPVSNIKDLDKELEKSKNL